MKKIRAGIKLSGCCGLSFYIIVHLSHIAILLDVMVCLQYPYKESVVIVILFVI
ncbi:protein of unknown function [Bartonella clarridgeiae 73]|uniref:Uncharacterized protein n=1 Tax=Bartonella clarridgeiae (strain CCUG 45776 / CIP 104772 / 73) TaxID=696125 RepID=E6YIE9_BARC7|nr:protein of unknown function [Bartonella clarridgeiae 73]